MGIPRKASSHGRKERSENSSISKAKLRTPKQMAMVLLSERIVYAVETDEVYLKFDPKFHLCHRDGNLYEVNVHFTYNKFKMRMLYQAVKVAKHLGTEFLFPSAGVLKPLLLLVEDSQEDGVAYGGGPGGDVQYKRRSSLSERKPCTIKKSKTKKFSRNSVQQVRRGRMNIDHHVQNYRPLHINANGVKQSTR